MAFNGKRPLCCDIVVGTRPEAIKLAPVVIALQQQPERFSARIVTSGQHVTATNKSYNGTLAAGAATSGSSSGARNESHRRRVRRWIAVRAVRTAAAGHDLLLVCHTAPAQRAAYEAVVAAYRDKTLPIRELEKSMARLDALDQAFAALSDPTRRAIVSRLARRPARVTDVAGRFPMSLNAVSKHLKVLEGAGLIKRRRAGREHHLELRPAPLREIARWTLRYERFWNEKLDALEAFLEEED